MSYKHCNWHQDALNIWVDVSHSWFHKENILLYSSTTFSLQIFFLDSFKNVLSPFGVSLHVAIFVLLCNLQYRSSYSKLAIGGATTMTVDNHQQYPLFTQSRLFRSEAIRRSIKIAKSQNLSGLSDDIDDITFRNQLTLVTFKFSTKIEKKSSSIDFQVNFPVTKKIIPDSSWKQD